MKRLIGLKQFSCDPKSPAITHMKPTVDEDTTEQSITNLLKRGFPGWKFKNTMFRISWSWEWWWFRRFPNQDEVNFNYGVVVWSRMMSYWCSWSINWGEMQSKVSPPPLVVSDVWVCVGACVVLPHQQRSCLCVLLCVVMFLRAVSVGPCTKKNHKRTTASAVFVRALFGCFSWISQHYDVATASSQRNTLGVNPCVRSPWLSLSCSLLPFKRSTFGQTLPRGWHI